MQSIKESLVNIFKTGTPEDPVDIHWQNEQMRQIIADVFPEFMSEPVLAVLEGEKK